MRSSEALYLHEKLTATCFSVHCKFRRNFTRIKGRESPCMPAIQVHRVPSHASQCPRGPGARPSGHLTRQPVRTSMHAAARQRLQ